MAYVWKNSSLPGKKAKFFDINKSVERRFGESSQLKTKRNLFYLQIILGILLVALLTIAFFIARSPRAFPIKEVKFLGSYNRISPQELQDAITPSLKGIGFFYLNPSILIKSIQKLPWVNKVTIAKEWPNKIVVIIDEQEAVGVWNEDSLINADGKIFKPKLETFPPNLPHFVGKNDRIFSLLNDYHQINEILNPLNLKISVLSEDEANGVHVVLDSGLEMYAFPDTAVAKIKSFFAIYPQLKETVKKNAKRVDFRYSNGFAINWM